MNHRHARGGNVNDTTKVLFVPLFVVLLVVPFNSSPSPVGVASSTFYFPHFVSGSEAETTFVVSNSSAQDAEVRFTAYDDGGNLIAGRSTPVAIRVAAQSQAQLKAGQLFKMPDRETMTGWVKAESANSQLSAWMLISLDNIDGDKVDGLPASDQVANRLVFSAVFQSPDVVTGIGLANPDAQAAHVKASLYSEGRLAEVREFEIPAYGHRAWFLEELFTSNVTAGHVEIVSDVGLVGLQQFSYPHQWSAVPMQLAGEASELAFPVPRLGENFWAGIALANLEAFDLDLTLTAWGAEFTPVAGPARRVIKPHGELITLVSDLFSDFPSAGGFVTVRVDAGLARPELSGLVVVGRDDLKALASFSFTGSPGRKSTFFPTGLQMESGEKGFLIIPAQTFESPTSLLSSATADRDQPGQFNAAKKNRNQPPTVYAGPDQTITLPSPANLTGMAFDDGLPSGKLTTTWSQVNGPGTVIFANINALSTTASFSTSGSYVLRLTASDDLLSSSDDLIVTVNSANQYPTVNAGPDQTVTLPSLANLNGSASDDGLPAGSTLTTTWSKISGPGTVTFGNAGAPATTATFSAAGSYVLRLTASDTVLSSSGDMAITVNSANQPPTVNAGPDQTVTLPSAATLNGVASDDGLPAGSGLTTTWSKISGPGTVTFGNASAPITTASFSTPGAYVLRLSASDTALTSSDDVAITVNPAQPPPTPNSGLSIRVVGSRLVDGAGQTLRLLGVNRSGTEYACVQNWGIFDGPDDAASVQAMKSWNINTVRIPLNEDCWLGIKGVNPLYSGAAYQDAIANYVNLLHQNGMYAVLELHWAAPGATLATKPEMMANQDHSPSFWTSVATRFKNDPAVIFDLYNEPHDISDGCWRDGCTLDGWQAVGMQSLITTIRGTGATQPIMVTANGWGNNLDGYLAFVPADPLNSLIASMHVYDFTSCNTQSCWDGNIKPIAATFPTVLGEIGEIDCAHGFIDTFMNWLDANGAGYLGWAWNVTDCRGMPSLITDYSGTPTNFGIGLRDHLLTLNAANSNSDLPASAAEQTATQKLEGLMATTKTQRHKGNAR